MSFTMLALIIFSFGFGIIDVGLFLGLLSSMIIVELYLIRLKSNKHSDKPKWR